jgi:hypothetical protein
MQLMSTAKSHNNNTSVKQYSTAHSQVIEFRCEDEYS